MRSVRFLAWRFMLRGTERGQFSPMTLFAWVAIGVGVAAMSCLLSVMYGFESSLKERILKAYPHVMVKPPTIPYRNYAPWSEAFSEVKEVARVVPYVETEMIVQSTTRTLGSVIWGMPSDEFNRIAKDLKEGSVPDPKAKVPEVVVGSELAFRLGAAVGDTIKVISPIEKKGLLGLVPQSDSFRVSGIYSSGHYDFDQQYLFFLMEDAQQLLKWGTGISGWQIWANDLKEADRVAAEIKKVTLEGWEVESWTTFNAALFQSLQLEQYSMFSILSFAVLIAVLNVVITLLMHVTHKRRNIGILRALGASQKQIQQVFVWQGAFLGLVGLSIGAVLTATFFIYVRYFSKFQLPDIYYDRSLPIELRPVSIVVIYLVAVVLVYLGTLYPSKKAAELNPIQAIKS